MIEAVPHKFFECVQNRSPDNAFICAAAVASDYDDRFVKMSYSNLRSIGETSSLDQGSHSEEGVPWLPECEKEVVFGALARTLTSMLDEVDAPLHIDFLSLDVEGADFSALKGIDFINYKFSYILLENNDLDKPSEFRNSNRYHMQSQLSHHNYSFKFAERS